MDFAWPFGSTPVSQLPSCHAVAPCGRSPTFVKFSVLPALIRTRAGTKPYSTLLPPILIVSTPVAIGPTGPATVGGGGGGHRGPSCPFKEKVKTASTLALPCSLLPTITITTYC